MSDTYVINSAGKPTIIKAPDANLDYAFDWTNWLAAVQDTIASFVFTPDPGITVTQSSRVNGVVIAWVDGGIVGNDYNLDCEITTAAGRIDSRNITIKVRDR